MHPTAPLRPVPLRRPVADLRLIRLDVSPAELRYFDTLLSADETARANRFIRPLDRARWIAARGQLRIRLGEHTGRAPQALQFLTDENGRPSLAGFPQAAPDFNLAHSGALALLAICDGFRVGADIEAHRNLNRDEEIFALAACEAESLARLHGPARAAAFFRYWTLKEAFLKALGTGLGTSLQAFALSPEGPSPAYLTCWDEPDSAPDTWHFDTRSPAPGYSAAVALQASARPAFRWHRACISPADAKIRTVFLQLSEK